MLCLVIQLYITISQNKILRILGIDKILCVPGKILAFLAKIKMSAPYVLCFLQNKIQYVPGNKLVDIVASGFKPLQIEKAKEQLFEAASAIAELSHIRSKKHKSTGGNSKEVRLVGDMVTLLAEADRLGCVLPTYVAVSLNTMPQVPQEVIDVGAIVFSSLCKGEDSVQECGL